MYREEIFQKIDRNYRELLDYEELSKSNMIVSDSVFNERAKKLLSICNEQIYIVNDYGISLEIYELYKEITKCILSENYEEISVIKEKINYHS